MQNWAYYFELNNDKAGVGTLYYTAKYFDEPGRVNPATGKTYSQEELTKIKNDAKKMKGNYIDDVPDDDALVGMKPISGGDIFWYDYSNSKNIVSSSDPLFLDPKTGELKNLAGSIVAKPII